MGNQTQASINTLSLSERKSRYGISYLQNICAQAGIGMVETPSDEDVLAVDCMLSFSEGEVRVQVKCTSSSTLNDSADISQAVRSSWQQKWNRSRLPIYLIVVIVPDGISDTWIEHPSDGTAHATGAFWLRVDGHPEVNTISIPKANRFTADTIAGWHNDFVSLFGGVTE